jgi:TP901 family phage tail tape measure protein
MPQKIENKDIFSPDFLEPQKKSFKEIIELIKLMEAEMKDVLKVQQQMVKTSDKKSVEGLKKRQRAVQSVNQVSKEMLKLEKQRKAASAQLQLAETKEAKAVAATRIELARKKKAVKDEILAEKGLIGEYQKQSARLNDLRKKYKDLILVQGKETRETKKLRKEITTLDTKLKQVDANVGQFQRSVGNYGKAFGKVTGVLRNLGLAVGGLAIFKNIATTIKEFDQSMANLSSITGATGKDLDFFKEKAIELGSSTTLSANQVAEGFKLIASAKPELLADAEALASVTEQAIILAEAAGIDLPIAAESLALSLNQFGAGADEASKFIDVLAAGSKKGAGDINFLNGAMLKVGGAADAAGLSFVDTVAVLETLAPVLGTGEEAGTKFRNILANLQKEGFGFASGQFNINEAIAETNEMLNAIQDPAEKAARRIKLFGKQNDAAGIQLLNNTKALEDFQVSLAESGIALEQQRINNDTLQGSLKALSSAWEGIVLGFENGTGVFAGVKDILFALARNLKTIIKFVVAATGVFLSYKAGIIATNIATKLAAAGQKLFAIATGKATFSVKAFSTALKLNPIGLFVTVLGTAITAISLFGKGVDQAAVTQERYNKGLEKGNELGKEQVGILQEQIAEQFRLIGLQEEAGDLTSVEAKEAKLEVLMDNRMTAQRAIEESQKKINHLTNRYLQYTKDILTAEERKTLSFTEQAALERERRNRASETVAILTEQQKEFKKGLKEIKNQEAELTVAKKNQIDEIAEKESAALKKLAADRRKELSLYRKRLEDLQDAAIVSGFNRESQQLKRKFERDIAAIKGNSQVEIDLRKALEDALQKELEELREKYEAKEEQLRLEDSRKKKEHREKQNDEALAIDEQYFNDIYNEQKKQLEIRAKTEEVAASEFLNIELDRLIAELELLEIYGKDTTDKLKEIADKKHQIHLANLDELAKADADAQKKKDKADAKRLKQQQDQLNALKQFSQKAIEISNAKTDKEIENIDKEIAASKTRQTELQTLAAQGNLTAEQSVSAEIKRELELERQKEALEKKKARRQIIIEGLDLLSSKIDSGQKDAVTSTLNDMTRLLGALAALPGFIDGTETTVGEALGKPQLNTGTDDYIVRVDGAEKILNPSMSARTGNMTTEEITRAAEMYSSGMFDQNVLIHPQVAALNQPFQNSKEILKKFDSLESTIKNKPILSDLKFDDLQKALVVTVEQNGDLKRAHYKLK